jgi:hypothetical protein
LESDKRGKNHEGRREDITNRNAIDEDLLRQPAAKYHCFCLDERDGGICATEGKAPSNEPKDKKMCQIGGLCNAKG